MNIFDYQAPLSRAAGFALSAVLLWLGAEVGAAMPRERAPRRTAGPATVAILLIACGMWWPAHFASGDRGATVQGLAAPLIAWLLALPAAILSRFAGRFARRKTIAASVMLTLACMAAVYAQSMFGSAGFFSISSSSGPQIASLVVVLTALVLVGMQLDKSITPHSQALRAFGAPLLALLMSLGIDLPTGAAALHPPWSELLLTAALAIVTGVLLRSLHRGARRSTDTPREISVPLSPAIDALTQLPTRNHFEKRLASAMKKCDHSDRRLALLFIDLDGFKPVNDTYGHSVGDTVLEQVGQRMKSMSLGKDIVARVGGDEFLLMLSPAGSEDSVTAVAQRLIDGLSQSYAVENRDVNISCSIGIAFYPADVSVAKLIARADAAMYSAKRAGGSTHRYYTPEMEVAAEDSFELLNDLRKAVANDELELFYQPKIDARSGKVTAAEALLRWNHPTRGEVMPGIFIPLAERSGLITALGNWVIEDACRQGRVWRDQGLRMRVAINLSPQQMRREDIVAQISASLEKHRIHPSLLTCEITESVAMEDTKATQETFRRLGELGAHLSIDDFGTGYSSLSYLRKLPAQELKIDRSFVMDLDHSADARAVVEAVIKLSHALGLKVVAEGVENQRQQQILVEMGCDALQGYLFAKPMSARALLLWAMSDRTAETMVFTPSLFGETKQAQRV